MIPRASWILGNHSALEPCPHLTSGFEARALEPPYLSPEVLGKSSATELHLLQFIPSWQLDDFLKRSFKLSVVFLIYKTQLSQDAELEAILGCNSE